MHGLNFSNKEITDEVRTLRRDDILHIVKILLALKDGHGEIDDIDHLGNRRLRSCGGVARKINSGWDYYAPIGR